MMKRSRNWTNTTRKKANVGNDVPLTMLGALMGSGINSEPKLGKGLGEDADTKLYVDGRHIYFQDDINFDTASALIRTMNELATDLEFMATQYDLEPIHIVLHITSHGGVVLSSYMIIDAIEKCKLVVDTVVDGISASCGSLISMHGQHRSMGKNAIMLCHQISSGMWGDFKESEQEDHYINLKQMSENIRRMYSEKTTMTKTMLKELLKHDIEWNAEQCLKYGLIDEIIY